MTDTNKERGSEAIRSEIEATRRRLDDTCDRLAERLQPRHLLNDLVHYWQSSREYQNFEERFETMKSNIKEMGQRAGNAVLDHAKENPLPMLLVGAGLAWLVIQQSRSGGNGRHYYIESDDYQNYDPDPGYTGYATADSPREFGADDPTESGSGRVQQAKEKLSHAKEDLVRRAREVGRRASEQGEHIRARAEEFGHRTKQRLESSCERGRDELMRTVDQHPLATGVAFLALGALASFFFQPSNRERTWLGDASDNVRRKAREKGEDLLHRGQHVAQATFDSAKKSATEQGLTPEGLAKSATTVAQEAKSTARRTAREEGLDLNKLKEPDPNQPQGEKTQASTSSGIGDPHPQT